MSHQFLIYICSLFNKPNLIGSTKQLEGTVIPCSVPKILSDFTGLLFQVLGKFLGLRYPWFLIGKSSETSYVSLKTWSLLNEDVRVFGLRWIFLVLWWYEEGYGKRALTVRPGSWFYPGWHWGCHFHLHFWRENKIEIFKNMLYN